MKSEENNVNVSLICKPATQKPSIIACFA